MIFEGTSENNKKFRIKILSKQTFSILSVKIDVMRLKSDQTI